MILSTEHMTSRNLKKAASAGKEAHLLRNGDTARVALVTFTVCMYASVLSLIGLSPVQSSPVQSSLVQSSPV